MTKRMIKPPPEEAAGLAAAASTAKFVAGMGVVRGVRTLLRVNQQGGFDCPGCAWPEPKERSFFEFCENGAKHIADEATPLRAGAEFFAAHSIEELAAQSEEWLNAQGRLTEPLVLRDGSEHYERISWDEAFALVAGDLARLDSPNQAAFYTSGRTSNEAAFLYQLFVRQLGTNNLPDCSNMCHESSGVALKEVVGVGKGTVRLEDFEAADAIFVIGQNPGSNHPRMLTALEAAAKRGCQIVSINPLREPGLLRFSHPQHYESLLARGTPISTLYLQVRVGGDAALLRGIQKHILESGALDHDFIAEHTTGFDAFAAWVRRTTWEDIEEQSGVSREQIREAAAIAIRSERTIACWAMGLTQHKAAVATIQEVANLLMMRGNIGRAGAGLCPVRGHSNVQGDRTMGICEQMPEAFYDRLGEHFDFEPPRAPGFDTVGTIEAMLDGRVRVFVAMGGNFLSAAPDTERTGEALRKCDLTVHVATKLNRSHVVTGRRALILPCLGRTEVDLQNGNRQFVTVENSMGLVHPSEGRNAPASEALKSEPAIIAGLAKAALGDRSTVDWDAMIGDYDRIRDGIARVVDGCEDYDSRVREAGGFYLRNAARERDFRACGGKARFTVHELPRIELGHGQLLMMTMRSHDQFNTTVYTSDDRYRGVSGNRRVVFMNADDIAELGLEAGQEVDLVSHFEGEERRAPAFTVVAFAIPRKCAATYFPEANPLVPLGSYADKSRTPTSKSVVITVERRKE